MTVKIIGMDREKKIRYIALFQSAKTVVMGDLAAKFKLKTQSVIARIEDLLNDGTLTGYYHFSIYF